MAEINKINVNGADHNIGLKLKLVATGIVNSEGTRMDFDNELEYNKFYIAHFLSIGMGYETFAIIRLPNNSSYTIAVVDSGGNDEYTTKYLDISKNGAKRYYVVDEEANEDTFVAPEEDYLGDELKIYELPFSF